MIFGLASFGQVSRKFRPSFGRALFRPSFGYVSEATVSAKFRPSFGKQSVSAKFRPSFGHVSDLPVSVKFRPSLWQVSEKFCFGQDSAKGSISAKFRPSVGQISTKSRNQTKLMCVLVHAKVDFHLFVMSFCFVLADESKW